MVNEHLLVEFARVHSGFLYSERLAVGDVLAAYNLDNAPIPPKALREGYFDDDHLAYWLSGYLDAKAFLRATPSFGDRGFVIDLGCSTGRVLRHLQRERPKTDFLGVDLQRSSIDWNRQFLFNKKTQYFHSSSFPYLPFEANSADAICAFSVFTHIADHEEGWLLELRRILKPGGTLYLTVMTDRVWPSIKPGHPLFANFQLSHAAEQGLAEKMPEERVIWQFGEPGQTYGQTVFHSEDYLLKNWMPFFSEGRLIPFGHNFQDVMVLTK